VPIAAQFWIVDGSTAVIYKLAHREDAAALSPGTLLTARMIEEVACAEGLDGVSFGYGEEAFKEQWMDRCLPVYAVEACPRLSSGALRFYLSGLRRSLDSLRRGAGHSTHPPRVQCTSEYQSIPTSSCAAK
jgi:hypothetical protein